MSEEVKEVKKEVLGDPERRLPMLKEGMRIKYSKYGTATVLFDEACGECVVSFDGKGARSIHMRRAHELIDVILDEDTDL